MSKYEALPQFLASVGGAAHRMSFNEIERVLGFKLPKSAYQHEAWWSNNATGHSHAKAWLQSGWRTEALDLAARKITFQRREAAITTKQDPWGCMAGTITILSDADVTLSTRDLWNAEQGILLNE